MSEVKTPGIPSDQDISQHLIYNSNGMQAVVTNYGAIVMSLLVPDMNGHLREVILGYDTLEQYTIDQHSFGALVGRCANRIAKGRCVIDQRPYQLSRNEGINHLHGGFKGWGKVIWTVEGYDTKSVKLKYRCPDGEEGYPGNVEVKVTYVIEEKNTLSIDIEATTDRDTIVNPTTHCYFNLNRHHLTSILDHELFIDADFYTPVSTDLIPTGQIAPVIGTPLDFTKPKHIRSDLHLAFEQLHFGKGYDHNWVLNTHDGNLCRCAALHEPTSGMYMEMYTNQPGLQFYSGNFLHSQMTGKHGIHYYPHAGLCLEAQGFPDAVNHPNFPSVIIRRGERYHHLTQYRFLYL